MARLVVVSNRVALPRRTQDAAAGGLAVALRDALSRAGGLWFGWSGRMSEAATFEPKLVEGPNVTYATIDLTPADHEQFYVQFANSTIWPLFHYRVDFLQFRREALAGYMRVNEGMARALATLIRPHDVIWIHDYHFLPMARMLRDLGVANKIGYFLHIPFPTAEVLRSLPRYEELISELAAYDLVGLQTRRDEQAFRANFIGELGAEVLGDGALSWRGRRFQVAAFPIGIDTSEFSSLALKAMQTTRISRLRQSLGGRPLVVGADRLDYSKGIDRRLDAFEVLLEKYPEHRGRMNFLQLAPLSREDVTHYQKLRLELEAKVGLINGRFGEIDWTPVRWVNRGAPRAELAGICRIARVGFVTPLRDGMNLVAKEFVAAQDPEDPGVLVLSKFAGAAEELGEAVIVNPFDAEGVAEQLHRAITMPLDERKARWRPMFEHLRHHHVRKWCADFLGALQQS